MVPISTLTSLGLSQGLSSPSVQRGEGEGRGGRKWIGPLSIQASLDPSSNSNAAQHYDNSWRLSFHVPGAGRKTVPTSECCAGITVDLLLDPFQSLAPGSSNPLLTFFTSCPNFSATRQLLQAQPLCLLHTHRPGWQSRVERTLQEPPRPGLRCALGMV